MAADFTACSHPCEYVLSVTASLLRPSWSAANTGSSPWEMSIDANVCLTRWAHGYRSVFVVGRAALTMIGHNPNAC